MSHFAEIDENGKVLRVIVADQSFIDSGRVGDPKNWVETSYETKEGVHKDGGVPLRKNYAGIGYTYDKERDFFIPIKPEESFIFDVVSATYKPPKAQPKDGKGYEWDENALDWKISDEVN